MKKLIAVLMFGSCAFAATLLADSEEIAFYPFKDRAAGESAVGVAITNAVDGSKYAGRIVKFGNGDVKFSDERPGKYVFRGLLYNQPDRLHCTEPGSLYFDGSASSTNDACQLFFDEIARELAAFASAGTGKWVIEFYYKMADDYTFNPDTVSHPFLSLKGNWKYKNPAVSEFDWLRVALRNPANTTNPRKIDFGGSTNKTDGTFANMDSASTFQYPANTVLRDGRWHQMELMWPPAQGDTLSSALCFPEHQFNLGGGSYRCPYYYPNGEIPAGDAAPLILNEYKRFKGWISCLRIRKETGSGPSNYTGTNTLYATECATCLPPTLGRYRLEEFSAGTELGYNSSVSNSACGYDVANPQIYTWPEKTKALWSGYSAPAFTAVVTNHLHNAKGTQQEECHAVDLPFSAPVVADTWKPFTTEGKDLSTALANASSLSLGGLSDVVADNCLYGPGLVIHPDRHPLIFSSHTLEFFFKFDAAKWAAMKTQIPEDGTNLVTLAFYTYGGTSHPEAWRICIDLTDVENPRFQHHNGTYKTTTFSATPAATDGNWHHFAFVKGVGLDSKVYFDYRKLGNVSVYTGPNMGFWTTRYFYIGSGDRGHGFPGLIDEVRLSAEALAEDQFQRAKTCGGLLMLVR